MNVVDFARQVLSMHELIIDLKIENERLREVEQRYNELLDSSLKTSQESAANWLKVLMKPGVIDAIRGDKKDDEAANNG